MSVARTIYDWLGNKLDTSGNVTGTYETVARASFTEAAFGSCASYIGAAISQAEVRDYYDGTRADRSWNEYVWSTSPNLNQESSEVITSAVYRMLRHGRAVVLNDGTNLYLADGSPMPEHRPGQQDVYRDLCVNGYSYGDKTASEVFVFASPSPQVQKLVQSMDDTYASLFGAAESKYRSSAAQRYKLKIDSTERGIPASKDDYTEYINSQLQPFIKSDRAVLPEYKGMQLEAFDGSSQTANDFLSIRKDCFETVATAMRMPTSMLYGNVNNFSEVFRSFMTFTVAPIAKAWEREITRKTYGYAGWRNGSRIELDLSHLKYTDIFDAAESADKLIASSLLSPDGVLAILGQDPIGEEWSGKHFITKNYAPAGVEPAEGVTNE